MNDFELLLDHDRRAVLATADLVARLGAAELAGPTPCDNWTGYELVAHMTGQQLGFAAAARGGGADLDAWAPSDASYEQACVEVVAAFAAPGVAERGFVLPEIRSGGVFPAPVAIGFHLLDNVVHAWDVAASLGVSPDLDEDVVVAAFVVAEKVPSGPERLLPGASFAPAVADEAVSGSAPLDRMLRMLGRSPGWSRPGVVPR